MYYTLNMLQVFYIYIVFFIYSYLSLIVNGFFIDYKHGFDYRISSVHLHNSIMTYFYFLLLLSMSIIYFISGYFILRIFFIFNLFGLLCSINSLLSGFFRGWSQWGVSPSTDYKITLISIPCSYFIISTLLLLTKSVHFFYICSNCFYILYHIPILKYNVFWFSEMHQISSIYITSQYLSDNIFFLIYMFPFIYLYFFLYIFICFNNVYII